LPMWNHAVFVDWHGVMNKEQFWASLLIDPKHRLHAAAKNASHFLFHQRPDLIKTWMKGRITSDDIISALPINYSDADRRYLTKRLFADCRRMKCDASLLAELKRLASYPVLRVLATDNMDCFLGSIEHIEELENLFDIVLCSSSLGCLKSEDPQSFFGRWLSHNEIRSDQSLLLDDSESNCQGFRNIGGTSVHVDSGKSAARALRAWRLAITHPRKKKSRAVK